MKKSLFALAALLAVAGTAQAQTSVTLYGVIDGSIEYVNRVGTAPANPVASGTPTAPVGPRFDMPRAGGLSASRWGLRGTEDLGTGWSALFNLESGFDWDTGNLTTAPLFNRTAIVGLSNAEYGKVTFGRQYTAMTDGLINFSPLRFAATYEPGVWWLGVNYRQSNMAKYTGNFGGLQAVAHYSFGTASSVQAAGTGQALGGGETPGSIKDNNAWGASLAYFGSGVGVGIAYDEWHPAPSTTPGNTGRERKAGIGVSYTTGPLKVMGGYRYRDSAFNTGATLIRDDYWFAGVNYQATAALGLQLGYYYSNVKQFRQTPTGVSTNPANPQQVAFVADYNLSKRTDVYIATGFAHNGSLINDGQFTAFLFGYPQAPGQKNMVGVTTGIRHIF
ncbi:Outer membrane porin protein [Cupriavidus yeoncheonensis]|uniref:Outer membrane porin protein n=1 Tax=Cupriavidus yeoncheonensis TaxID=1462994 RepID=A0A916IYT6_9BURK|nr:porin [Cupriavidus yeoncheonensis]CAG2154921.1 Outer membrane porin protein [Cupriavidus yeoncheonensis]